MTEGLRFFNVVLLAAVVLSVIGVGAGFLTSNFGVTKGVLWGTAVSLFNVTWGFFSIRWAFQASSRAFLSVLVGGMFLRFIVVGSALYWAWKRTDLHFVSFVVALLGTYFLLQILEIRFVQKQLAQKSK